MVVPADEETESICLVRHPADVAGGVASCITHHQHQSAGTCCNSSVQKCCGILSGASHDSCNNILLPFLLSLLLPCAALFLLPLLLLVFLVWLFFHIMHSLLLLLL